LQNASRWEAVHPAKLRTNKNTRPLVPCTVWTLHSWRAWTNSKSNWKLRITVLSTI